jgi:prevent-host-death family protein
MKRVSIHAAKTNLSKLIAKAVEGEPFVITKAGKPLVKVVPIDSQPPGKVRRFGFMTNQMHVPDDFDRMGEKEINRLFKTDR